MGSKHPVIYIESDNKGLKGLGTKSRGSGYLIPALRDNYAALVLLGFNPKPLPEFGPWDPIHPSYDKMYQYQKEVCRDLVQSHFSGALLLISPGLGKTMISIVGADLIEAKRILVICPKSIIPDWSNEIKKWSTKPNVEVIKHKVPGTGLGRFVITNYDHFCNHPEVFKEKWDLVIIDESILIKNRNTARFKSIQKYLFTNTVWLLSGSPVAKYNDDLWTQMAVIYPEAFKSYWRWAQRFCRLEHNGFSQNSIVGNSRENPAEVYSDLIFRREQKQVHPDLPEIIHKQCSIELTPKQARAHTELKKDFITKLESGVLKVSNRLALDIRLQQIVSGLVNVDPGGIDSAKHDYLSDRFETRDMELPIILWTNWVPSARQLYRRLISENPHLKIGLADGSSHDALEEYKAGKLDVLVLALNVGKYGHTLIRTKTVFYVDLTDHSDTYIQSLARVQRIGLEHSPVVNTLRCPGTIDDLLLGRLAGKMPGIASITDKDLATLLRGLRW